MTRSPDALFSRVRIELLVKLSTYILPQLNRTDLVTICNVVMVGALATGAYGAIHDQLTYTISSEYFTNVKFEQFNYLDIGLSDRAFVGAIGFLAAAGAGVIISWFLARRFIPNQPRDVALRLVAKGLAVVFVTTLLCGLLGFAYGLWCGPSADYSSWKWVCQQFRIEDTWSFVRVAYIHNASYLGGLAGTAIAFLLVRPRQRNLTSPPLSTPPPN